MSFPGVIELSLSGRGPSRGFVFDPHRLAYPCWAQVCADGPALLVTFDRHFDVVAPLVRPPSSRTPADADAFARTQLDERNVDHILAAMEAGFLTDALIVARAWPVGAIKEPSWTSPSGSTHQLVSAPTLERLLESREPLVMLETAPRVVLDFDLDCFVTPSDADPFTLVPWPETLIREFLKPTGSERFWQQLLDRCVGLTFAREPNHCGGLIASNRLFESACRVIFEELLETDLP